MYCQICMLEIVVCWRICSPPFAAREHLQTARFLSGGILFCVFWQEFSLFLIRCALYLHACLLWLRFIEMRLNIACRFCMWKISCLTFALTSAVFLLNWTYASVKQCVETFQKLVVRNPTLWFLTEHFCAKILSIILILKKSHPK